MDQRKTARAVVFLKGDFCFRTCLLKVMSNYCIIANLYVGNACSHYFLVLADNSVKATHRKQAETYSTRPYVVRGLLPCWLCWLCCGKFPGPIVTHDQINATINMLYTNIPWVHAIYALSRANPCCCSVGWLRS